jgi:hypothetical protein
VEPRVESQAIDVARRKPFDPPTRGVRERAAVRCRRSPRTALFQLARERRFIIRAEGASGVRL